MKIKSIKSKKIKLFIENMISRCNLMEIVTNGNKDKENNVIRSEQ